MALTTPVAFRQVGASTGQINATAGVERQIIVDTSKHTVVVMDGAKTGGYPLALESVKIKSGSPNLRVNNGEEATLLGDIVLTMNPGYIPTGFEFVKDPAGQPAGVYLQIRYRDEQGVDKSYMVDANLFVSNYTAGDGVVIDENGVISLNKGSGFKFTSDGKLALDPSTIDWSQFIDPNSLLRVNASGKLSTKPVVSADNDNILAEGSDKGAYLPGDLGSL